MTELVKGRYITDKDMDAYRQVCVISEKQAAKIYGDENPIGKIFTFTYNSLSYDFTVVGVYKSSMSKLMSAMWPLISLRISC